MSDCPRCNTYDRLRGARIRTEIAKTSEGEAAQVRWDRFIAAYHARHLRDDQTRLTAGRFVALMATIEGRWGKDFMREDAETDER